MSSPVWKGTLSYGVVSLPVKVFSGPRPENVHFKQLRSGDLSAIKQILIAEADEKPVGRADIVKGYEIERGRFLSFTDEELAEVTNPPAPKELRISSFVDVGELDPLYLESSYYLAPGGDHEVPYAALLLALRKGDHAGVGWITISTRERLAVIRSGRTGIILNTLFYPVELRRTDEFRTDTSVVTEPARLQSQRAVRSLRKELLLLGSVEDRQSKRVLAFIEKRLAQPSKEKL